MALFEGLGVAMITPFDENGINYETAGKIIEYLISGGTSAIFALGTTGEPPTMSEDEKYAFAAFVVATVKKRIPVFIGCGCNCTADTVNSARRMEALGADGLLVVTPYYNKCTQDGVVAHYRAVSDAVSIPVVAYNVPARTGVNILPSTVVKLAELKNIRGYKEASGDIDQIQTVISLVGDKIDVYSGDDNLTFTSMCLGAKGVISVVGNAVPHLMSALTSALHSGDIESARNLNNALLKLFKKMFIEVNPIPVKWAMNYLGFDAGIPRLPLTELLPEHAAELQAALDELLGQ